MKKALVAASIVLATTSAFAGCACPPNFPNCCVGGDATKIDLGGKFTPPPNPAPNPTPTYPTNCRNVIVNGQVVTICQ